MLQAREVFIELTAGAVHYKSASIWVLFKSMGDVMLLEKEVPITCDLPKVTPAFGDREGHCVSYENGTKE